MDAKHQLSFRCNEVEQVGASLFYFYSFFIASALRCSSSCFLCFSSCCVHIWFFFFSLLLNAYTMFVVKKKVIKLLKLGANLLLAWFVEAKMQQYGFILEG